MAKRLLYPVVSRHFKLFEEDLLYLEGAFGTSSARGMSMNEIIRTIVHDAVRAARAAENEVRERAALLEREKARRASVLVPSPFPEPGTDEYEDWQRSKI